MQLVGGGRLGPYEILGPLGAGGMGEVYRATDTRLNRTVAIKVLTAYVGTQPEHRQRFEREARVVASLSHPNICVLYDVGDEDGLPFIVMEYLEGETLAGRFERGPLPVDRAIAVAGEILDALDHAHRRGVVHRDLKPSNVMLTRAGVKLLDFGLAKPGASGAVMEDSPDTAASATRTMDITSHGTIVGTLHYMAPEQLHGQHVDARTDIFAFGGVLYEMVTGHRAFSGPSQASVIAAILERQPEALTTLAPAAPALLDHIVRRCLAKDPGDRWQSAADLRQAMAWAGSGMSPPGTARSPHVRPARLLSIAAVVAATMVVSIIGALRLVPGPPDISAYRFSPLAAESDYQGSAAWSPDGKTIAYVAESAGVVQVFTRSVGSAARVAITKGLFDCRDPFWSHDGTQIFFISRARDREGLYVVGAAGGEPSLVVEDVTAATLSSDDQALAFVREVGMLGTGEKTLWIASPPTTAPTKDERLGPGTLHDAALRFSPDSKSLGIWGTLNEGPPTFWIAPFPSGQPRVAMSGLPAGFPSFSWLPDNRHIVATISQPPDTHLWIFDTATGRGWPVTSAVAKENRPAVAPDGTRIALNSEQADFDLQEIFLDGSPSTTLLATSRQEFDPTWATGDRYAFVTDRMGGPQIWIGSRQDAQGGWTERPLVTEQDFPDPTYLLSSPVFAPDGQRVAFNRQGAGPTIYIKTLAGGAPVPLLATPDLADSPTWSPDGKWIAFTGIADTYALKKVRVGTSEPPIVIEPRITPNTRPQWSPDGRWILCDTQEGLALISPDARAPKVFISDEDWFAYAWQDASHVIGIRQSDTHRLMLSSLDAATRKETVLAADLGPVPLTNFPIKGLTRASPHSVAIGLARVRSSLLLLEGFRAPGFWDRLRASPRPPWQN